MVVIPFFYEGIQMIERINIFLRSRMFCVKMILNMRCRMKKHKVIGFVMISFIFFFHGPMVHCKRLSIIEMF